MKLVYFFVLCFALNIFSAFAQENKAHHLPSVEIKTLSGKIQNTSKIENEGNPVIISFWATWCKPCVAELTNISEVYDDWKKETGVKLIAVTIDDARNVTKIGPFVNGKNWDYDILLDSNGDFKRAMNVNTIPHTFLVNGNGEIVWQHNSYTEGDEEKLFTLLKKLKAGENLRPH